MHALGIGRLTMLSRPLNVLVADGQEPMRKLTASQLRDLGARSVQLVKDGGEAWKQLRGGGFDLVVSDIELPVANGLQLLRSMRAEPTLAGCPFLLLTASAERAQIEQAIALGVSAILLKPYTQSLLLSHVERALRTGSPRRVAAAAAAPAVEVVAAPEAAPEAVEALDERLSLLVVDDTADNLVLLSQLFKEEYRVRLATNGHKALELCQSARPPDLVLLDVMMPGMDGFELARLLRERPDTEHIPIVFITAMDGNDARLRGLDLGAVDFITKPIDPELLRPKVRNFMRLLRQRRDLQNQIDLALDAAREQEAEQARLGGALRAAAQELAALQAEAGLSGPALQRLQRAQALLAEAGAPPT